MMCLCFILQIVWKKDTNFIWINHNSCLISLVQMIYGNHSNMWRATGLLCINQCKRCCVIVFQFLVYSACFAFFIFFLSWLASVFSFIPAWSYLSSVCLFLCCSPWLPWYLPPVTPPEPCAPPPASVNKFYGFQCAHAHTHTDNFMKTNSSQNRHCSPLIHPLWHKLWYYIEKKPSNLI